MQGGIRLKKEDNYRNLPNIKVSVVTVVYNGIQEIEATIQSVLSQNMHEKEYIIIDGSSTDGTLDVIKKYDSKIDFWISESDEGIYDAMNKGLTLAKGRWTIFINSGDLFCDESVLSRVFQENEYQGVDVLYGNSVMKTLDGNMVYQDVESDPNKIMSGPFFRHNATFFLTKTHLNNPYKVSLKTELGFSLDYKLLYDLYNSGKVFKKINTYVISFTQEGISNDYSRYLEYVYKITKKQSIISNLMLRMRVILFRILEIKLINKLAHNSKSAIIYLVQKTANLLASNHLKVFLYKKMKTKIGKNAHLGSNFTVNYPNRVKIGSGCVIGSNCELDSQGGITIGNNVEIGNNVKIITTDIKKINSKSIRIIKPIHVESEVIIGDSVSISSSALIGAGTIIKPGSVVKCDVPPFSIASGNPAQIEERTKL